MRILLVRTVVLVVLAATAALLAAGAVSAGAPGPASGGARVVSALGMAHIQGQDVLVDILVAVQPGEDARAAAAAALQAQSARPFDSAALGSGGFTLTGLVWDALPVVQNYNSSNEPTGIDGQTALTNTHATWNRVTTSFFEIKFGEPTDRCPSLVRECAGPQTFDGKNDVGWLRLDRRTLGVTWFGTSTLTGPEADIALNIRFNWANDGSSDYDVQTVFLHENGHVVGLGHSNDPDSVMQPSYHGVDRVLGTDDEEGATYLYDTAVTGSVSGTVTDGISGIEGATVVLEGTSLSATTASDGSYTIPGVPDPVTYDVTASADGFESASIRQKVDGPTAADFSLSPAGEGGGGNGACPPAKAAKGKC